MESSTEYDNRETYFDLSDISSFLYSTGYINRENYNNINKQQKSQQDYEIILEKNINITMTDASVKYGELLSKINKLFDTNLSFEDYYFQYKIYTKIDINFGTYLNYLIILVHMINNYSDYLKINSLLNIDKEKISIIEIDFINNQQKTSINNNLEKLYKNIKDNPIYNDKEINSNLIILLFFLSLNNTIIIDPDFNNINDLISNFSLFNKLYVSNIDLGLFLYIESIFFIYRYAHNDDILNINNNSNKMFNKVNQINSNLNDNTNRIKRKTNIKSDLFDKLKKPFTSRTIIDTNTNFKNEIGELTMTDYLSNNNTNLIVNNINNDNKFLNNKSNIPNLYLFDNETIKFPYNSHLTIFMFQNYLKLFSFYHLSKHKISLLVNLTIRNLYDLREEFPKENNKEIKKKDNKINLDDDEEKYNNDYYSFKNYTNYNFNIFENINIKNIKYISLENICLLNINLIYLFFKNIYFNELLF